MTKFIRITLDVTEDKLKGSLWRTSAYMTLKELRQVAHPESRVAAFINEESQRFWRTLVLMGEIDEEE